LIIVSATYLKSVQIEAVYNQLFKMKHVNKSGSASPGTHRFQRAGVGSQPIGDQGAPGTGCARLQAIIAQGKHGDFIEI